MKHIYLLTLLLLVISCTNSSAQTKTGNDEVKFRKFLNSFKIALRKNEKEKIKVMLNYPFYTKRENSGNDKYSPADPIKATEYIKYRKSIFHEDVVRLLPGVSEDELSEIDRKTDDSYYQVLWKSCDPGSKLFETYLQYPTNDGISESYFAFVFGKIKGKYKVISYYAKWPVKDW
ncbi:hypothetical protein H7F33_09810 [Pedobacter sp. PAMC26386]|nr:hypothetical protein H7F33_09810 [Pedobacter sp. PAMC26386]